MKEIFEKIKERLEDKTVGFYDDVDGKLIKVDEAIEIVNQVAEEYKQDLDKVKQGWIPVSSGKLPEDFDNRFYMCIVENHEEDLPMFCQYEENYGFGFWHDIYDGYTLGFVDSEFKTNEELGYEKVIAWQPIPEPYQPEGE